MTKMTLIIFIAVSCVQAGTSSISWIVFAFLMYFCINITLYIVKPLTIKRMLQLLSIILSIVSHLFIYPLFILLLPLSFYELTAQFIQKKMFMFIVSIIPLFYISGTAQVIYGLTTVLSFMIYCMTDLFGTRVEKNENKIDDMRKAIQRLTKRLNENNEYIRQSKYTFKLEERNRISQEIHDKIGHSMTGALIQLEAAKRLMATDKNKAAELLQNAINISKDGIEQIRITLKNMKPPTEQVGIHKMKLFLDEFLSRSDLKTSFTYEGNMDIISPIQWKIIHENVTEALTNAMKYSDATGVSVDIKVLNKLIKVEVKDNGKGTEKIKKGLGIIGMEERTASLNGNIIVDSTNGFSVTTLLPLSSHETSHT